MNDIEIIYKKMIAEKLSLAKMAELITPKITRQGLRYRLVNYCKEAGLDLPKARRGAKPRWLQANS